LLEIDTNVIVRYLVGDDADQFKRAVRTLETHDIRVSATVLLETEWVLRSAYKRSPKQIIGALRAFLSLPRVFMEKREAAFDALAWTETGVDFADALHLAGAADAEAFLSFDRDLAKQARKLGAPPVRAP
jgi:predicted nucleic acid-binding protein